MNTISNRAIEVIERHIEAMKLKNSNLKDDLDLLWSFFSANIKPAHPAITALDKIIVEKLGGKNFEEKMLQKDGEIILADFGGFLNSAAGDLESRLSTG